MQNYTENANGDVPLTVENHFYYFTFVQSRKCMSLKFTEELCARTMKNDTKIEEELTSHFKIDMRNFTNFDASTGKSKKFVF